MVPNWPINSAGKQWSHALAYIIAQWFFLNRAFIRFRAGAVRFLVLGVGVEPAQTKQDHPPNIQSITSPDKEQQREYFRRTGHRATFWSSRGSTIDLCRRCQMRLLGEMFDFQMNTIPPLHCAAAAHHVKAIWNYDWWVKLWLIRLVIPVYMLFIPLQLMRAASLCFPSAVSKTLRRTVWISIQSFFLFKWLECKRLNSTRTTQIFLLLRESSQTFPSNVLCGGSLRAESANLQELFLSAFCFYNKLDTDM